MSNKNFSPDDLRMLAQKWSAEGKLDPALAKRRTRKGAKHAVGLHFLPGSGRRSPAEYRREHKGLLGKRLNAAKVKKQKERRAKKIAARTPISQQLRDLLGEKQKKAAQEVPTSVLPDHSPTQPVD